MMGPRTQTTTPRTADFRFRRPVAVPVSAVIVSSLVLAAGYSFRLPSDVAIQWSQGAVATVAPLWIAVLSTLGPAAATLACLALARMSSTSKDRGRRSTVGVIVALTLILSFSLPLMLAPSLGIADPWLAPDPGVPGLAVAAVAAVILGTVAGMVSGDMKLPSLWRAPSWVALVLGAAGAALLLLGAAGLIPWPAALCGGVAAGVFFFAGSRPIR
ncbi:multisubunit Na+/H+ antiporter MnhB subunit [Arthrobacter sp. UYP6]